MLVRCRGGPRGIVLTEQIRTNAILNDRYLVQKELGQGGMGAVYMAQDLQNRRTVAIKVARLPGPEARAQFQREAGYLQKLHHHSLPRVWDYFSDTQRDFLVMEYIPGEDLETLVHRKGPQAEWLVLRWIDELLDGLEYLHGQNPPIIHRDIKPGNLKLRQDETLVLVDFGIAKEYLPGTDTSPGANAVTPGFSPLEQYSGIATDARTDIYSVGATMYFLLTAQHPAARARSRRGRQKAPPPIAARPRYHCRHRDGDTQGAQPAARRALGQCLRDARRAGSCLTATSGQRDTSQDGLIQDPRRATARQDAHLTPEGTGKRPAGCMALMALAAVALLAVGALVWSSGILKPDGATAEPSTQIAVQATAAPAVAQRATFTPMPPQATASPTVAKLRPAHGHPRANRDAGQRDRRGKRSRDPDLHVDSDPDAHPGCTHAHTYKHAGQKDHRVDVRAYGNVSGGHCDHIANHCPDRARRRRSRRRRSHLSMAGRQPPAGQSGLRARLLEARPGRHER